MADALILTSLLGEADRRVGLITLNRPKQYNALNDELMDQLGAALLAFDADDSVGCIVITGNEKAFAAGADIREMAPYTYPDTYLMDFGASSDRLAKVRKPVIAAVAGFALGGGCELAMMCDFIIAGENAKFGQPEIKLGVMPGFGGSQRLTRAVGKAKAMDLCLTGRMMDAAEAERSGLVSRIVPVDKLVEEALAAAATIADFAPYVAMLNKEAVNAVFESTLAEGIHMERRLFQPLFGTEAQKEGMAAFIEKRKARFHKE